ncbi:probable aspartic protease At2g35615 [Zingiber officinale]|uniref:probable aspartic protease At2g35615 n=1 Tax=Zingiber officinale TaxID=94328 RepID=UPI001C4C285D|nr:probable aspartic protease At2g35615 [Zingiber officinale]
MAVISTLFCLLLLISIALALVTQDTVFDIELVHRDSPKSPLYNSTMTPFDRLQAAVVRSVNRASYLDKRIDMKTSIDIELGLSYDDGEFFMGFKIGTPNTQSMLGIVTTGSGLIWANSVGCECFKKNTTTLFNPNASLSYTKLSCLSDECKSFTLAHCNFNIMCQYRAVYGDNSNIDGILSLETFSFTSIGTNQNIVIPNIVFGCNFRSQITLIDDPGSYIGLGPRSPSLIQQLAPKYIRKYFSHCLDMLHDGANSRLFLGRGKQTITGKTMVTPLMTQDGFYAVQLHTISIPGEFNILLTRSKLKAGNIIFDSGTVMTLLDSQVLNQLVRELTDYVSLPIVKTSDYRLCFNVSSTEQEEQLPGVLFSFDGTLGNIKMSPYNLFRWYRPDVKCMGILGTSGIQIFGNIMQEDLLVGYDLDNMELTITEKKCTELYNP